MLNSFFHTRRGNLIESVIGIILMGVLSYGFWVNWHENMSDIGENLRIKIESDSWLD